MGNSYHRSPRDGAPKLPLNVAHTPAGRRPGFQDLSHIKVNTHQDTTCHLNLFVHILKASKCAVSFSFHSLIVRILAVLGPPGKGLENGLRNSY